MSMFSKTTAKNPEEYIELLSEPRRDEVQKIHEFIVETVPSLLPLIQSGMIGYGTYHYVYKSGQEGDWSRIALASQKNYISIYVSCVTAQGKYLAEYYIDKLPKASIGKSCIRFKNIADIDWEVLREILITAQSIHEKA